MELFVWCVLALVCFSALVIDNHTKAKPTTEKVLLGGIMLFLFMITINTL